MAFSRKQKIGLLLVEIFLLVIICLSIYFSRSRYQKDFPDKVIKINNRSIMIEVAANPLSQYIGLSNRDTLCPDCGMWFVFPDKQVYEFVMRDMKFPLDIIFIEDDKIINIASNLPPEGDGPVNSYKSLSPVNRVLELNGGYCQKYGIKAGDIITSESD